jgi:hypothetical protein
MYLAEDKNPLPVSGIKPSFLGRPVTKPTALPRLSIEMSAGGKLLLEIMTRISDTPSKEFSCFVVTRVYSWNNERRSAALFQKLS